MAKAVTRKKGKPYEYDPEFHGPVKKRSCTDIICFFLFVGFIVGWIVIGVIAFSRGDPSRLLHPTDSLGLKCGLDEQVKDKPNLLFFDITRCFTPDVLIHGCATPQICVEKCPQETYYFPAYNLYQFSAKRVDISKVKASMLCKYGVNTSERDIPSLVNSGDCPKYQLTSTNIARRCIPSFGLTSTAEMNSTINDTNGIPLFADGNWLTYKNVYDGTESLSIFVNAQEVGSNIFQDLVSSWPMILVLLLIAMVVSFFWILLMRCLAGIMVWLSLLIVIVLLSVAIWYSANQYIKLDSNPDYNNTNIFELQFTSNLNTYLALKDTWLFFLILSSVTLFILVLVLIFLRNRIRIAVTLIGEASKAVGSMMCSLFFPMLPWLVEIFVIVFTIATGVFLASAGEMMYRTACHPIGGMQNCTLMSSIKCDPNETYVAYSNGQCNCSCQFVLYAVDPILRGLQFYNIFGMFWTLFFIAAFGEMALAGAFSSWYWSFNKSDVPTFALTDSVCRTTRYHLGTLAFGSLIIAIVRFIRFLLECLEQQLRKYENWFCKAILCCCKCWFWCLEKFLKFINRNAYIITAIYGKNFCAAAKRAFGLLMRNVVRVVVLDKVTDFLLLLGKLMIVTGMGVLSFFVFSGQIGFVGSYLPRLHYYFVPIIVIVIGTYFIATMFFGVYAMAVDTLFLCFLDDSERNDGSADKPYYMPKSLMKIIGKKNKKAKAGYDKKK